MTIQSYLANSGSHCPVTLCHIPKFWGLLAIDDDTTLSHKVGIALPSDTVSYPKSVGPIDTTLPQKSESDYSLTQRHLATRRMESSATIRKLTAGSLSLITLVSESHAGIQLYWLCLL